jgi:hypothetical protein
MLLRALFVLMLASGAAFADTTAPSDARTLPLHRLRGPFASLDAYCAQRRHDDDWVRACTVERRLPHTAAVVTRALGDQRTLLLAVEDGGWWIDETAGPEGILLFDGNRGRGSFVLLGLADRGARLRGAQGHWRKLLTDEGDIYYCFALEVRCYTRDGAPACTDPLPVAGRDDCRLGSEDDAPGFDATHWDWRQELRDDGDALDVRRLRWRAFPTRFDGYNDWMRDTAARALALAGRYRLR